MQITMPLRIDTTRLILRQFTHTDWFDLHQHYSDPDCTQFTFRKTLTEAETWRAMASMAGHWALRGYGPYAMEEKSTGQVLGTVGLWYPNDWPEAEIKWALSKMHWGKGFASEAVRSVQSAALAALPDLALISFIHVDNLASHQLARSVGCTLEKQVEFRGGQWCIYRHPRI